MNYSRKDIVSWVESQSKYKFQELKNGVFFCRMLMIRFPEDAPKLKYNPAPISEYDYLNNLTSVKKLLNKHGLQLNLNVEKILNSKNNFDLAKWFKALVDKQISIQTVSSLDSSKNLPKEPSSSHRITIDSNFPPSQTPRNRLDEDINRFRKHLESTQKANKHSSSAVKRLSMAKSEQKFFKNRIPSFPDLKIPVSKKKTESKGKLNDTQHIKSFQSSQKPEQNINNLLYERALEESIEGFQKILYKIQQRAKETTVSTFEQYKQILFKSIFEK